MTSSTPLIGQPPPSPQSPPIPHPPIGFFFFGGGGGQSGGANGWRVCYQLGLPRLVLSAFALKSNMLAK